MERSKRQAAMEERHAYWRGVIEEAESSGLSNRAFCRGRGVNEHLFYHWRRVLKLESALGSRGDAKAEGRFVLVSSEEFAPQAAVSVLELAVDHGWKLRIGPGTDSATLRMVLDELAHRR